MDGKEFSDKFKKEIKKLTRKEKLDFIYYYLAPNDGCGLEIGPYVRPIISPNKGWNISYMESESTDSLRARAVKQGHNPLLVPKINYIADKGLAKDVGSDECFDYVVSSHVVEHAPDFVSHFQGIEAVLVEGGLCGLVIPDKQLTLDFIRPCSSLGDVIEAYLKTSDAPSIASYIDSLRYSARNLGKGICWGESDATDFQLINKDYSDAIKACVTLRGISSPPDWLGHSWVFSVSSFLSIFFDLQKIGLINLNLVDFYPTGYADFIVILSKGSCRFESMSDTSMVEELSKFPYAYKSFIASG